MQFTQHLIKFDAYTIQLCNTMGYKINTDLTSATGNNATQNHTNLAPGNG